MIRPIDIQEKVFTRAVRGYKEEEVNEFLDEITVDLDSLLNELRETREENSRLVDELQRLKTTEGSVAETLQAAKSLMTDISASAEKRAEILPLWKSSFCDTPHGHIPYCQAWSPPFQWIKYSIFPPLLQAYK
jgi:DivIVA domain-containing protein